MNYLVWQLLDSGFPSGGFVHSSGLEASVQHGHVVDADDVRAFARQTLAQAGRSALPLMRAAHRTPADLATLDRLADVFLSSPVANRASRAQGRALLTAVSRSFPRPEIDRLDECLRGEQLGGHVAPLLGAVLGALGIDQGEAEQLFLFSAVRGVASAAVRLGLIGAYDAQSLQAELGADIDRVIRECEGLGPYDIAQTAPLIDLFQSTHDRLYSRLFQS